MIFRFSFGSAIAITASFLLSEAITPAASLAGCNPYSAATTYHEVRMGGGTTKQAWNATYADKAWDGTETCWRRIIGYIRSMPLLYKEIQKDFR